jgi:hypothetical protein
VGERFKPLSTRSKLVIGALAASILCDLFAAWVDVREIRLMNRVLGGDPPALSELTASDDRQALAGGLALVTFIVTIVLFLMWFARAYKNLVALGATDLRFTHGWAVGAWFVPILNLWRPKQIANDIWRASDPALQPTAGASWRERPVSGLLTLWWLAWVVSVYGWNLSTRLYFSGDGADDLRDADYADLVALSLDITAAALAIAVVRKLTERQSARAPAGVAPGPALGATGP